MIRPATPPPLACTPSSSKRVSFSGQNVIHELPKETVEVRECRAHTNSPGPVSKIQDIPVVAFNELGMKEFAESEEFWKDLLTLQDIALARYEDSSDVLEVFGDCADTFASLAEDQASAVEDLINNIDILDICVDTEMPSQLYESFDELMTSKSFWDDFHSMHMDTVHEKEKEEEEDISSNLSLAESLSTVFESCGDAFNDLSNELFDIQEQMKSASRSNAIPATVFAPLASPPAQQQTISVAGTDDATAHMHEMDSFVHSTHFWDEVIAMQTEATSKPMVPAAAVELLDEEEEVDISFPCPFPGAADVDAKVLESFLASALSVFDTSGESIAALSGEVHLLPDALTTTIQATAQSPNIEELPAELSSLEPFMKSDIFWSEVVAMQADANNTATPLPPLEEKEDKQIKENEEIAEECGDYSNDSVETTVTTAAATTGAPLQTTTSFEPAPAAAATVPSKTVIPSNVKQVLRFGSLKDDMKVLTNGSAPLKQVVPSRPEEAASEEQEVAMKLISSELGRRANKGPDVKFLFTIIAVAFSSILCVALLGHRSPTLYRVLWASAFGINVLSVSIPGRLDRMYNQSNHIKPWTSLFEPATWAFAIWGVIYLLELLLSLYVTFVGFPPQLFQRTLPYWLAGNWFQALWCFVFRPEFKKQLWVPTLCLLLAGMSFSAAHGHFNVYIAQKSAVLSVAQKMLIHGLKIPLSIHSAWLFGATLLNFNSWVALSIGRASRGLQVMVAFASAFAVAAVGIGLTCYTQDPCFAATCAWALDAVASRTKAKTIEVKGLVTADVQESLAVTESSLSLMLKATALATVFASGTVTG